MAAKDAHMAAISTAICRQTWAQQDPNLSEHKDSPRQMF